MITNEETSSLQLNEDGIKYSEDGEKLLSCSTSFKGHLVVQKGVETIADNAFKDCVDLYSIELPNSIKEIGKNAFFNCQNLVSVYMPDSVISIGDWAFSGCIGLTEPVFSETTFARLPLNYNGAFKIPFGITKIAAGAFDGCANLTSVEIPDNVNYIGDGAFIRCTSLINPVYNKFIFAFLPSDYHGEYKIPNGIKEIAGGAFRRCRELTSVVIPYGLQKIGAWSFSDCSQLSLVNIPGSVKEIGACAFKNCTVLKLEEVSEDVKVGENAFKKCGEDVETKYSGNKQKLIRCAKNFSGIFEIPNGVKTICAKAFENCKGLTSVVIPDSVTYIENEAFCNCIGLKSIYLPDSVTNFGIDIFAGCFNIEKPIYNKTKFVFLPFCFQGVYTIPSGIIVLSSSSFKKCKGLNGIEIPNSVLAIGRETFKDCTSLKSVRLPESVNAIRANAFEGCSSLESIKIPDGVKEIRPNSFKDCSNLRYVMFPDSLMEIGSSAFSNCINLHFIDLPNSLTKIGNLAFDGCTNLTEVSMPNSVKGINESTFRNCSNYHINCKSNGKNNSYLLNSQYNKPLLFGNSGLTQKLIYINEYRYAYLKTSKTQRKKKMFCLKWEGLAYRKDNSVYVITKEPFVVIKLEGSFIGATLLNMIWKYKDKLEKFPYYYDGSEISSVNLDSQDFFNIFSHVFPASYMATINQYRDNGSALDQASFAKNSIFQQWLLDKRDRSYPVTKFNEIVSALTVRSDVRHNNIDKSTLGETGTIVEGEVFTLKSNVYGYCKLVFESKETSKATIVANVSINERFESLESIKKYLESYLMNKRSNSRKNGEIKGIKVKFVNHNNFINWKSDILNY